MKGELCLLLAEEPDLGHELDPVRGRLAAERLFARVARIDADGPAGERLVDESDPCGLGLLVLDGLLVRRVGLSGRFGAEVLGPGDLLRPWQGADMDAGLTPETVWRLLRPCRVAVLDPEFIRRAHDYPEVLGALTGRALGRSRQLAAMMAIVHQRRLDQRLLMLLWLLAGRWGTVGPQGVELALPLSHGVLAELVAARRPSVTTALGRLAAAGRVQARAGAWLLAGHVPDELTGLGVPLTVPAGPG